MVALVDSRREHFLISVYVVVLCLLKDGLVKKPLKFLIKFEAVSFFEGRKVVFVAALFLHMGQPSKRVVDPLATDLARHRV